MRLRIAAAFSGALVMLAWVPGASAGHKDGHPGKTAQVNATTLLPDIDEHRFVPPEVNVLPGATVEFTNGDFPPHSWTVLTADCVPSAPGNCEFDTGRVEPGNSASVDLTTLQPGTYTIICTMGQRPPGEPEDPEQLIFPPHARQVDGEWTGMVGTLTVGMP